MVKERRDRAREAILRQLKRVEIESQELVGLLEEEVPKYYFRDDAWKPIAKKLDECLGSVREDLPVLFEKLYETVISEC